MLLPFGFQRDCRFAVRQLSFGKSVPLPSAAERVRSPKACRRRRVKALISGGIFPQHGWNRGAVMLHPVISGAEFIFLPRTKGMLTHGKS